MEKFEGKVPFSYERGKCKLQGTTKEDRKALLLEIILHWTWKIILACSLLIGGIYNFFYRS